MQTKHLRNFALALTTISTLWLIAFFGVVVLPSMSVITNVQVVLAFSLLWVIAMIPFVSLGVLGFILLMYSWWRGREEKIREAEKLLPQNIKQEA